MSEGMKNIVIFSLRDSYGYITRMLNEYDGEGFSYNGSENDGKYFDRHHLKADKKSVQKISNTLDFQNINHCISSW